MNHPNDNVRRVHVIAALLLGACGGGRASTGAAGSPSAQPDAPVEMDADTPDAPPHLDAASGDGRVRERDAGRADAPRAGVDGGRRDAMASDSRRALDARAGDGPPLPPGGPSPYALELGGGPAPYRHLTNGAMVPWVHGPQGLPMIILAVRARGFATGNPTMPSPDDPLLATTCTNLANGMEVGAGRQRQGLAMQPDGWAEFYDGWTPFVGAMPLWLGQRLRCTATLSDAAGHMASDVREVVVNVVEGM